MPSPPKLRLGEILVKAGLISESQLQAALAEQRRWGGRLGRLLVDMGLIAEPTVAVALSRQLGMPCVNLATTQVSAQAVKLLPVQAAERFGVMPLALDATGRVLRLATSDPTNYEALHDIAFSTGFKIDPVLAGPSDIDKAIRRYYYGETEDRPARTAVPADFGMRERTFGDPAEPVVEQPATALGPTATEINRALVERMLRLEDVAAKQARALRALVETLEDCGLLDHEGYVKRLRGKSGK
jgi:type IV pilus assembly protein PilB